MKTHPTFVNRFKMSARPALAAFMFATAAFSVRGETLINWNGQDAAGIGNFGYCDNWYYGSCPSWAYGSEVHFSYNNHPDGNGYNDLGGWVNIDNIYWDSTFGSGLTWNGNGNGVNVNTKIENDSSYAQVWNIPLSVAKNGASSFQLNPVNAALTILAPVYNNYSNALQVWGGNSQTLTVGADLAGGAGPNQTVNLTVEQYSIVKFTAGQTWGNSANGVNINQGEMWMASGGSLANASVPVNIGLNDGNTAKLWLSILTGGQSFTNPITVNNSSTAGEKVVGGLNTNGTSTFYGAVTLNGQINLSAATGGTDVFAGPITGSGQSVVVNGYQEPFAGVIVYNATNTYSGSTYIAGGTLQFNATGSASNSANYFLGEVTGSQTATLALGAAGGGQNLTNAITVRSGSTGAKFISSLATSGNDTLAGTLALSNSVTLNSASGGNLNLNGVISGNGWGFTNSGAGKVTLGATNTYTGSTILNAGTLALGATAAISNTPLIAIAAGATLDVSAISAYSLTGSNVLRAAGTGPVAGTSAALINGASAGSVSLGTQAVSLVFTPTAFTGDTAHPALLVTNASLTLNNNALTVSNATGTALGAGTYRLIQTGNGSGGSISGTPNATATITGSGVASGTTNWVSVASGNVILTVQLLTTNTLTLSAGSNPSTYGSNVTFQAAISPAPANGETVTFLDGVTTLGTGTLASGVATFTTNALVFGSHPITAVYAGDATDAGSTSGTVSLTVNKATVTVASGLTANSKIYDGTTAATISSNNVTLSGVIAHDTGSVTMTTNGYAGVFAAKNANTSVTVTVSGLSLAGSAAGNYALTQPTLAANISAKALTMSGLSVPGSKIYDGTTNAVVSGTAALASAEATGSGTTADGKPYTGDTVSLTGTATGYYNSKDVATASTVTFGGLSLTGAQATNYSLTVQSAASATITVKALTMSGLSVPGSKIYDGTTNAAVSGTAALPAAEAAGSGTTVDGKPYTGDTVSFTGTVTGYYNSKDVATAGTVTFGGLSLTGTQAADYSLTVQSPAAATITAKGLTAAGTLAAQSKVYNGTTNAVLTGAAALLTAEAPGTGSTGDHTPYTGDTVGVMGTASGAFASPYVANGVTVNVSGISLSGAQAGDYSLTVPTLNANITAASLTVTANNASKAYGQTVTFAGTEFTTTGLTNGDTVTGVTLVSSGATNTATAGTYPIAVSGATGSGLGNYTISYTNGTLTVNPAGPTLTVGSSQSPIGYLGSVTFSATLPADATGSVVFSSTNGAFSTNTLSGGSASSVAIASLARGTNVITVVYGGDGNYLAATNLFNEVVTNHAPAASVMTVTITAGMGGEIALTDLATNWTDADGDMVELTAVNLTTTNGVPVYPIDLTTNLDGSYVINNLAYLGYTNPLNLADQISYSIGDGFGGTNIGYINIVIQSSVTGTNSITAIAVGNPNSVTAYGVPGFSYVTERSTNLMAGAWVEISTNVAATNGVINVTDPFSDLGSNAPAAAFYRLLWHP